MHTTLSLSLHAKNGKVSASENIHEVHSYFFSLSLDLG